MTKRGGKNSILRGRLQNAPTQRTLKMIDAKAILRLLGQSST